MGAKKKVDGKKSKTPEVISSNYVTIDKLKAHYKLACKLIGTDINNCINSQLVDGDDGTKYTQLLCNTPIGPAGTRAITLALLGVSRGMIGEPYKELTSMRFWGAGCADDGVRALASLLKGAPIDTLAISYLELLDCDIKSRGCLYLGEALGRNGNITLTALLMNHNTGIGDDGVINLCRGLKDNRTLQKLHLQYCGIESTGAMAIASMLLQPTVLTDLNLCGNSIGNEGLIAISQALKKNGTLKNLSLADNSLSGFPPDNNLIEALEEFGSLLNTTTVLETIVFDRNHISKEGGAILLQYVKGSTQIKSMTVDIDLPEEMFAALSLNSSSSGGKKKKGKGKGKKK